MLVTFETPGGSYPVVVGRDLLEVPLQPGDRVAFANDPEREPFEVTGINPTGGVFVAFGLRLALERR